jgi:hypothetical protein
MRKRLLAAALSLSALGPVAARAQDGPQSITITITVAADGTVSAEAGAGLFRRRPVPQPQPPSLKPQPPSLKPAPVPSAAVAQGASTYYRGIPAVYRQIAAGVRNRSIATRDDVVTGIDQGRREVAAQLVTAMDGVLDRYSDPNNGALTDPFTLATILESAAAAMEQAR